MLIMENDTIKKLIKGYYNYLMDEFNGNASEEAIGLYMETLDKNEIEVYTESDLRLAFKAGKIKGEFPSFMQGELDEDEYIDSIKPKMIIEKEIPITLGMIKATCGWYRYCEITGSNEWMLREWSVEDSEIFYTKKSHAVKLGLIK
jgi:hypothetical protein